MSKRRWHLAVKTIFCSRILLSLLNNARAKKNQCLNIDLTSLSELVKEKNLDQLQKYGGIDGVTSALETDVEMGIRGDDADIARRYEKFGSNKYEAPPVKSFFHFLMEASKDVINVIHLTCAAASLGFGIKTHGLKEGWYEGGSIFAGVLVFIFISAASNFNRSRHFNLLSSKVIRSNVQVGVVRNGKKHRISMFEILVGDVICLKHGDQVPADGLYLDGHSLQVDELCLTGHSDHYVAVNISNNPFLVSGTKVCMVEGDARMLVTSVGNNTVLGEIVNHMSLDNSKRMNPQTRLDKLTSSMFLLYCLICTFKNIFSVFQENLVCILFLLDGPASLSKFNRTNRLTFPNIYRSRIQSFLSRKAVVKKHCTSSTINDIVNSGNNFFKIDRKSLIQLFQEKNFYQLQEFGGIAGMVHALDTDIENGIRGDVEDVARRLEAFGSNEYDKPPFKSFLCFFVEALKDPTIIILLICASLTLCFGIIRHGLKGGWYDGGSIYISLFLDTAVSSISNFRRNKQFYEFPEVDNNRKIDVVRGEQLQQISVLQIVVGDVISVKTGDKIPADGLFLEGSSFQVDESMMAWHSDLMEVNSCQNPFLFSGTKVVNGHARMLVTCVGMNTVWGKKMSQISEVTCEENLLQAQLNEQTSQISKVGLLVGSKALLVLLALYFKGKKGNGHKKEDFNGNNTKVDNIVNAVLGTIPTAITVASAAVPEGLPLVVIFALAYSTKRMTAKLALVRNIAGCRTMGSVTTICTNETGILSLNKMQVTRFWLGQELIEEGSADSLISSNLLELLKQGIALNTTCTVSNRTSSGSEFKFSGDPTEEAILSWAVWEMKMDAEEVKRSCSIMSLDAFNSQKKRSEVLIKKADNTIHMHWKGAAEIILATCSNYYDTSGLVKDLDVDTRKKFELIIQDMEASNLRCIAFAHKQVSEEKLQGTNEYKELNDQGLSLIGLVGIDGPCPQEVKKAVASCQLAGVNIIMITSDNVSTAKDVATECGILKSNEYTSNKAVVEGEEFRNYTPEVRMEKVDKICVMVKSSPSDKLLMVQCLKQKGHVVAVCLSNSANDEQAVKEAHIGLNLRTHQGAFGAEENSHFIILDGNFASVATIWRWGRCIHISIQKFVEFKLAGYLTALVINFVTTLSSRKVPLTEVELLWTQLIMDTSGALALAIEPHCDELLMKKNPSRDLTGPFITKTMWRNLLAQALYQTVVLLTLRFKGESIFGVSKKVRRTMVFNSFVLCQVLNMVNTRKVEKKNMLKWIQKNKKFVWTIGMTIVLQWAMVEVSKKFANTARLNLKQWGACIGVATASWLIGSIVKSIPV